MPPRSGRVNQRDDRIDRKVKLRIIDVVPADFDET